MFHSAGIDENAVQIRVWRGFTDRVSSSSFGSGDKNPSLRSTLKIWVGHEISSGALPLVSPSFRLFYCFMFSRSHIGRGLRTGILYESICFSLLIHKDEDVS